MEVVIIIYVIDQKLSALMQDIEILNMRPSPAWWFKLKTSVFHQHGLSILEGSF